MRLILSLSMTLLVSLTANARTELREVVSAETDSTRTSEPGLCIISGGLYKLSTAADGVSPIIPLEEARRNTACPRLRNYGEMERAYQKIGSYKVASNAIVLEPGQRHVIKVITPCGKTLLFPPNTSNEDMDKTLKGMGIDINKCEGFFQPIK